MTPRSVYVHVPFCRHRCGYCNFSLVANRDYLITRFLDAIEREIESVLERWCCESECENTPIALETLYLGGGTPSHLPVEALQRLSAILKRHFEWNASTEFTAECNPRDLNDEKLLALQQIGVNRISLGVQSFQEPKLRTLERDHSPAEAIATVHRCNELFGNVSIDLIFATPNETLSQWTSDVQQAIALRPTHLSTYELTYEKGTTFWNRKSNGELTESDDELKTIMYQSAIGAFTQSGYEHYEVSSFARSGRQSRHNNIYWTGLPFFGFGPGAASYVGGQRETRHQSPVAYMARVENGQPPVVDSEKLVGLEKIQERVAIGLRRREGIEITSFNDRNQCDLLHLLAPLWKELEQLELIQMSHGRIVVTSKGLLVNDWIAEQILR